MNAFEQLHFYLSSAAKIIQTVSQAMASGEAATYLIPDTMVGGAGVSSPVGLVKYGGENFAKSTGAFGKALSIGSNILEFGASLSSILGSYERRSDDWKLQENMAAKELEQMDKQILAAEIRLAIAEKELENHEQQIENAEEIDDYLKNKFTRKELYNYMVSKLSTIYFQSYQMAYELSKLAEECYRYEVLEEDTKFIQFGYWDSLKKGLTAGDQLHFDLRRMEKSYLEKNRREFEITKHISLALLDPMALIMLKETGECFISIPEVIFDLDYPGHYMRRIKSLGLTIPCVAGPYTSVSCTLTMSSSLIRRSNEINGEYKRQDGKDGRFKDINGAIQSIATSSAKNDSGIFELNFRDERYLPFEGAGVISNWHLELPKEFKSFDYNTISDVIFQIRYTARDGGEALKQAAINELTTLINNAALDDNRKGLWRMFSAKHEFPKEWHEFLTKVTDGIQKLELPITEEQFPFIFKDKEKKIKTAILFLALKDGINYTDNDMTYDLKKDGISEIPDENGNNSRNEFKKYNEINNLIYAIPFEIDNDDYKALGTRSFEIKVDDIPNCLKDSENNRLNADAVEDFWIVLQYSVATPKQK